MVATELICVVGFGDSIAQELDVLVDDIDDDAKAWITHSLTQILTDRKSLIP